MSLIAPTIRPTPISRANPVSKMLAALIITAALLVSVDWVSAAVALGLELLILPWSGLGARVLALRTAPVWIGAATGGFAAVIFGKDSGEAYIGWGIFSVTEGSLVLGIAIALRVLAVGLPGVVLFATTDPTDLADGLVQKMRLPARFVLGALAGLRLVGLLIEDWRSLALARRARGVADKGGIGRLGGQAFALLVMSIRRGTRLATAMEARGFGADDSARTWARVSTTSGRDAGLLIGALLLVALAVGAALAAGTWNFIFG